MADVVEEVREDAPADVSVADAFDNFEPIAPIDSSQYAESTDDTANEVALEDVETKPDVWGSTLPADPSLPSGYSGKTVKDLYDNERNLVKALQEYGEDRNKLRAQNELLFATVQQMQAQARAEMKQATEGMTKEEKKTFFESIGVDPNDVFDNPTEVLTKPFEALREEMYGLVGNLAEHIQKDKAAEAAIVRRTALQQGADKAWREAGKRLGIDEQTWKARTPDFVQHIVYDQRPNAMLDPDAYVDAYEKLAGRWGGMKEADQATGAKVGAIAASKNPPHATRTTSTGSGGAVRRLPKHIEREIASFAEATGHDEEWVRSAFDRFRS